MLTPFGRWSRLDIADKTCGVRTKPGRYDNSARVPHELARAALVDGRAAWRPPWKEELCLATTLGSRARSVGPVALHNPAGDSSIAGKASKFQAQIAQRDGVPDDVFPSEELRAPLSE